MKAKRFGPAIYFASDKNIFDALVQHGVDAPTITTLFERRNIIASKKTPRDDLAEYFSRLTHDYYDHRTISERLGSPSRRERTTSMDLVGKIDPESLRLSLEEIKKEITAAGDTAHISRNGDNFSINIQYSLIDYKKTEFSQVQIKDGVIEFIPTPEGYLIRNAQNEFMNTVRDEIVTKVDKNNIEDLEIITVSLFEITTPKLRTQFFIDLINGLEGFSRRDVSDVYVYKPKPVRDGSEELTSDDDETHIEKVLLKGNGVTRSVILLDLTGSNEYYIVKIGWTTQRELGNGDIFEIEALFSDPKDCTGFSILLKGIYPYVNGKRGKRRSPLKKEIDEISRLIESSARLLTTKMKVTSIDGGSKS
ncbi:hypothetical protein RU03_11075 [Pseudomonas simiae]|uniref:hypothetical protein n=1 Tax=Pseudomonas TaxID=286 RepID=UPI0005ACADCF|nr:MULTISPECIES: hypothetical protein [Pseudomonas]KIQ12153.1 hypothetical protein RU03_11075 [Pseudomonas simiae]